MKSLEVFYKSGVQLIVFDRRSSSMPVINRGSSSRRTFLCVEGVWICSGYERAVFQWLDPGQELAISIIIQDISISNPASGIEK
jgi:hypothetical protein